MPNNIASTIGNSAKTLADEVYQKIRDDIVHGHLTAGDKLKIEPLKKRYSVGASPLREALNRLSSDGFVFSKGQQGFNVSEMSLADLEDVTNVRILIENDALTQSILHGDDHWESNVVAAFHSLSKIENSENDCEPLVMEQRNYTFHNSLLAACDSKRINQFYKTLYDQHKRYRNLARGAKIEGRNLHEEHKALYHAALDRNIKLATEANEFHIRKTAEVVLQIKKEEW